jgi:RnfABCDGE-type electron transport complex B subunit
MMMQILTPVIAMAALGLIFGLGLAYALKLFAIKVDPALALLIQKLPGANCGACGRAGCAAFAEALRKGEVLPTSCVVTNEAARSEIAKILGLESKARVKQIAAVRCLGGKKAKDKFVYQGIKNCKAASLVMGGQKACYFGCLGFGDCVKACPFKAITMGENDLPIVNKTKCTGCGKCIKACPKNLFLLIPKKANFYVACNSRDKAKTVMEVCQTGCIACGKCVKAVKPEGAIAIKDNLAEVDYTKVLACDECIQVCPRKVILSCESPS